MKTWKLCTFIVIVLLISSCFSPLQEDTATITLNLGGGNSRSAIPWPPNNTDNNILKDIDYIIELSGNGEERTIPAKGESIITITDIAAGRWVIKIKAYYQDKLYATGENSVDVKAGQNNPVSVQMNAFLENRFLINNLIYDLEENKKNENMMFYFSTSTPPTILVVLNLEEEISISIDFYIPAENENLVDGDYIWSENENDFTFSNSSIRYPPGERTFYITGGTVKVSVSETGDDAIYTIDINCTLEVDGIIDDVQTRIPAGNVKGIYRETLVKFP